MKKVTVVDIQRMKQEKKKIVTMTAYDFQMARIIDKAGVDIILIGDSGGRYLLGHEDNNSVTMDEMVLMARCVSRGAKQALVVADMPFMSYQISREDAERRIVAQMSSDEKRQYADFEIDTTGTMDEVREHVKRLYEKLRQLQK